MSETSTYCKRASIVVCLSLLFVASARVSHAQEQRITQDLGSLMRITNSCCDALYTSGSYTVPDGKTLVIEDVFVVLRVPAGVKATGKILVSSVTKTSGGTSVSNKRYPFLLTSQGTGLSGEAIFIASHPLKLYVINQTSDPAVITVTFELRPQSKGLSSGEAAFSGSLEPSTP